MVLYDGARATIPRVMILTSVPPRLVLPVTSTMIVRNHSSVLEGRVFQHLNGTAYAKHYLLIPHIIFIIKAFHLHLKLHTRSLQHNNIQMN